VAFLELTVLGGRKARMIMCRQKGKKRVCWGESRSVRGEYHSSFILLTLISDQEKGEKGRDCE